MAGTRLETVFSYAILALFSLAVVLPVGWLLLAATSPKANAGVDLENIRLANFADAWVQADFTTHLLNSLIICVGAVVITSTVSILAGYGLTILAMPGSRIVFPIILAGIMIPLEGILVPLYFNLRAVGLTSSLFGLVIAHAGLGVSFGVFWMRATLQAVPRELVESAELDGAGRLRLLWSLVLPVIRPGLITMVLLMFMWTWNDYFLSLVFLHGENQTATVALGVFQGKYVTQINLMAAGGLIVAAPVLLLYIVFQRKFISGMLAGAIKE